MQLQDTNLDNIKLVVFDFDDTLAIHKDKNFGKRRDESEEKFIYISTRIKSKRYKNSSKNK